MTYGRTEYSHKSLLLASRGHVVITQQVTGLVRRRYSAVCCGYVLTGDVLLALTMTNTV